MNQITIDMATLSRRINYLLHMNDNFVDDEILDLMEQYNRLGQIKNSMKETSHV